MDPRDNQLPAMGTELVTSGRSMSPDPLAVDYPADTVTDRHLALVRSRLIANVGSAVASWFRIVPSDRIGGQLQMVALLLDGHLPILVPLNDVEGGNFFVASYDTRGRRVGNIAPKDLAGHVSLAEAILTADLEFRNLRQQAGQNQSSRAQISEIGELPEEQWLHHQLCRRTPSAEFSA